MAPRGSTWVDDEGQTWPRRVFLADIIAYAPASKTRRRALAL
jgi:hypothetical protein